MLKRVFMITILILSFFCVWDILPGHSNAVSSIRSGVFCKQDLPIISNSGSIFFSEGNAYSAQSSDNTEVDDGEDNDEKENRIINWTTVFEIILGAVLGFISTVTVGLLTKFASAHRLMKKMRQELAEIRSFLKDNVNTDARFLSISPIWEYIIHSDTLFSFSAKKYASIIRIYGEMKVFKTAEESATISKEALVKSRKRFIDVLDNYKI